MAEGEEPAARRTDEIAHGFGLLGMVAGALVGVAVGVAVVGAVAATGGAAAVIIAGAVAGGGLAGGQLVSGLTTIFNLPEPTTGMIFQGSSNVFINDLAAARASIDFAAGGPLGMSCNGLPLNHPPMWVPILIAEGSATVRTNDLPQSRLKSKMVCGAHLKTGSPNVIIGGPTERTNFVFDLESWFKTGLEVLGLAALVGAGVLAAAAGVGAFVGFVAITGGTMLAFEGLGRIGDMIGPGYRDLFQGIAGFGLLAISPRMARNARANQLAAEEAARLASEEAAHRTRLGELSAEEAASSARARSSSALPTETDPKPGVARNRTVMENRTPAERAAAARDRAEITRLSNESVEARARAEAARTPAERDAYNALADRRMAEAREVLRPHVEARDVPAIVERLDVSSPRDGGFLWSGCKDEAGALAKAAGGTTLEQTPGGRVIDNWELLNKDYLPWNEGGNQVWGGASERYAQGLSGNVRNIQAQSKFDRGGGDTFKNFEQPQVEAGQVDGRITGYDVTVIPDPPRH